MAGGRDGRGDDAVWWQPKLLEARLKFIGIDAGKYGAIAKIDDASTAVEIADCPLDQFGEIDRFAVHDLLVRFVVNERDACLVVIEQLHALPYAGKVKYQKGKRRAAHGTQAAFSLGRSYEAWIMVLAAYHRVPLEVPPQTWQSVMIGRVLMSALPGKEPSATVACQRWPQAKHLVYGGERGGLIDGRADALLIAGYGQAVQKSGQLTRFSNAR